MKKLVEQSEENLLDYYLGKNVLIHGAMYHYAGKVTAIDSDYKFVRLENAKLVLNSSVDEDTFEKSKDFKSTTILVQVAFIEMVNERD